MTPIFPSAQDLATNVVNLTTVNAEVRACEAAVLAASTAGSSIAVISNTAMTQATLNSYSTISAVNTVNNTITLTNHGLSNGQAVEFSTAGTAQLATPIVTGQIYYVTVIDANNFQISVDYWSYVNGIIMDITAAGSGTQLVRKCTLSELYWLTWQNTIQDLSKTHAMLDVMTYFTNRGYGMTQQTNTQTLATMNWVITW